MKISNTELKTDTKTKPSVDARPSVGANAIAYTFTYQDDRYFVFKDCGAWAIAKLGDLALTVSAETPWQLGAKGVHEIFFLGGFSDDDLSFKWISKEGLGNGILHFSSVEAAQQYILDRQENKLD